MKSSPGMSIFVETHRDIAFVAGDLELMSQRHAGVGHAMTRRLIDLTAKLRNLLVEFDDPLRQRLAIRRRLDVASFAAHVLRLFRVQRGGTLRAIAINCDRFQTHAPAFDVGVHDFLDRGFLGQVNRLGNRAAQERLRRGHHPQVAHIT